MSGAAKRLSATSRPGERQPGLPPYLGSVSNDSPDDPILIELQAKGSTIRRVQYRENRTVLLSVSRDGRTLNSHACFRNAPPRIVEAIATAVTRGNHRVRKRALEILREWDGTRTGLSRARALKPARRRRVNGETASLRALFRRFNGEQFDGWLPEIPLRVSRRMTRSLGTVRYGEGAGVRRPDAASSGNDQGGRLVVEIAISADLLRPPNQALLRDTLLHEMAHAEAWLRHGHRGHGRVWKKIARRIGCRPRAVHDVRVEGRCRSMR